MNKKIL